MSAGDDNWSKLNQYLLLGTGLIESYYNSPNVVMCVCLSLNYSFIFTPIVTKFGHPTGMAGGSSMKE